MARRGTNGWEWIVGQGPRVDKDGLGCLGAVAVVAVGANRINDRAAVWLSAVIRFCAPVAIADISAAPG